MGTQEIARYDWNDEALDTISQILIRLSDKDVNVEEVRKLISFLPEKKIHYTFADEEVDRFKKLMSIW